MLCAGGSIYAQDNNENSFSGDVMENRTRGAKDPEVTIDSRINDSDMDTRAVQPSAKGAQARGSFRYCTAYFDNWTQWYIKCYVDGKLEGSLAPYGEGGVVVAPGSTRVYAKAEFTDGSWKSWGPVTRNCSGQRMTMTMYETFYNFRFE